MKRILKYQFQPAMHGHIFPIKHSQNFSVLNAAVQGDYIVLWIEEDTEEEKTESTIAFFWTGKDLPPFEDGEETYINSLQWNNLVWHMYFIS